MSNIETDLDEESNQKKPRKPRKRNQERKIFITRVVDGREQSLADVYEKVIGIPVERRLPNYLRETFGEGDYFAQPRRPNGSYEPNRMNFSIRNTEKQNIVEIEPEDYDDEPEDSSFDAKDGQMSQTEVENLLLKDRLRRLEDEVLRLKSGNQSEQQPFIDALNESRRSERELYMILLAQAQKPQQDATTQAMNLLEKSFGMVTKARAISDELAPQEAGSSNPTYLGDASKLVDSLGKINIGQYLPLLFNRPATVPTANPATAQRAGKPKADNGSGQGELSDLLTKVKNKREGEKK